MYSNTQIEIALDDFFNSTIDLNRLNEILNNNGIGDSTDTINTHQMAVTAVNQYNLMKQVQEVHAQFADKLLQTAKVKAEPKAIRMPARTFVMRIAAGILLLLTGYTTVQYFNSTGTAFYESLHNTYHAAENRSIITEPGSELVEAYKKGNYASVIKAFAQLRNPGNRELFFAGNSYLESNNAPLAIALFEQVINRNKVTGELLYQDEAEYYFCLLYTSDAADE